MYRVLLTQWRIFRNEKRWDERREVLTVAVMWHRWMLGGRDDQTLAEIGDTKVMGWWHLILGGAQHCHLVSYCQHHRFTKDRLTNIGCLLNMSYGFISLVVSLSFWSLSKTENFGQMSWWCWVTSVFCGYQKTIIELIFPLASVFCWLSNVTLWCIDNGMDGGFLILRLGENWGESLIPRWWHLVGGELRWKLREPTLTNSFLIIIYKGEKWECHHDGREWVMSQYFDDGLPLPRDRWPPEEFDLTIWTIFYESSFVTYHP